MEVRLSVAVMHAAFDERRRGHLANLLRSIPDRVRQTTHFEVVKDATRAGRWPTARRAWMLAGRGRSTHHLVLQDDVLAGPDFLAGLKAAIAVKPDVPVAPYLARRVVIEACAAGKSWARLASWCQGQALVLPVAMVPEFLSWERASIDPEYQVYDSRLGLWMLQKKLQIWATCPSLVQHAAPGESLIGYSNRRRVAAVFIGGRSALEVDWSKGAEDPPFDHAIMAYNFKAALKPGVQFVR